MTDMDARRAAEKAARTSYGRLIAILSARSHDIAGAEDALAEAFVSALKVWPERGVPANPDAWLLTAARNASLNNFRHGKVRSAASAEIERRYGDTSLSEADFPDARLKLLFICAHPAIDEVIRTPLMLQTVLGLDAARIASAFLVSPATMSQRLVRAKAKIRDAGIRFSVPEPEHLTDRLTEVLDAIYAAYGTGWDDLTGTDGGARGLTGEAIYLGRLLVHLLPRLPEPRGLLALMLYCEARRDARRDADGRFVPLNQQDPALWSRDMIIEAEGLLTAASESATFGRFQCEAAIQSVHCQRALTGVTHYPALETLYDMLLAFCPSLGIMVGRAAMLLESGQPEIAATALNNIQGDRVASYQPYWVTRARIHQALGQRQEAVAAFSTAIGLTEDEAIRTFLRETAT